MAHAAPENSSDWPELPLSGMCRSEPLRADQNRNAPPGGKLLSAADPQPILKSLDMCRTLTHLIVIAALCIPAAGAEHKSWSKIRYVGGTIPVKTSRYDWNTTLTISLNPDSIELAIAPAKAFATLQTVRIQPSQISSLSYGPAAWRRVGEIGGVQLPSKTPSLFGFMEHPGYLGIVYRGDDGKPAAILLDTPYFSSTILSVLKELTGKEIERD
jgi:hypothetical protein